MRRGVTRKRFHDLLRGPLPSRIRRHVGVNDAPPTVLDDHEHVQDLESYRGDCKEVNRGNDLRMFGKKYLPTLRGGFQCSYM
jgi:hypothetical protein